MITTVAQALFRRTVQDETRRWSYLWLICVLFLYGSVNDIVFSRPTDEVAVEAVSVGVLLAAVWCVQPGLQSVARVGYQFGRFAEQAVGAVVSGALIAIILGMSYCLVVVTEHAYGRNGVVEWIKSAAAVAEHAIIATILATNVVKALISLVRSDSRNSKMKK